MMPSRSAATSRIRLLGCSRIMDGLLLEAVTAMPVGIFAAGAARVRPELIRSWATRHVLHKAMPGAVG